MFVKKKPLGSMLFFPDAGQDLIDVGVVAFSETLGQLYFADIEFCAESAVLAPLAL